MYIIQCCDQFLLILTKENIKNRICNGQDNQLNNRQQTIFIGTNTFTIDGYDT